MFESRFEIVGWALAILVVAVMAFLTFHGPFERVNKTNNAAAAMARPSQIVKILTDLKTIGRYDPKTVTIRVGQAVEFKNYDRLIHTVTSTSFNSGDIETNGSAWAYYGAKAGRYPFYCIYHPKMRGTLVVQG